MTSIIVILLLLGYVLIATGHLTGVNKAAIAMFIGTVGWVMYVCYGTDYVMSLHPQDYEEYLGGEDPTSNAVKLYIYNNVFLYYVGRAASIVMFLLSTMTIVEILNNNGCFDFVTKWIRTRNSKRLLWTITFATFILSANLDNLTTATTMLVIMRSIVQNRRELPERLDTQWAPMPYRGDETNLNPWQRVLMLFVGIGGLWFIPTFHNMTKLSPFLGALCVLSVLWIVNEVMNRKLMAADQMSERRIPMALQYGTIQQILFVMGIMLGMGVVTEMGVFGDVAAWFSQEIRSVWVIGIVSGLLSGVVDTFTIAVSDISLYPVVKGALPGDYMGNFIANGAYWKIVAYTTAVGGCLLSVGSVSGLALMKMEHMRLGWYVKNLSLKMLAGALVGLAILWVELNYV